MSEEKELPAFYARGEHVLWVDIAGRVVNGAWNPEFSDDMSKCWAATRPEVVFEHSGRAPMDGNYNEVIERFLESFADEGK